MPNSFSQLCIHLVFAVKYRSALIPLDHKENLHRYITGIITHHDCKLITINSVADHIHIFIGLHPKIALSDLVRDVKSNATLYIKGKTGMSNFAWQEGFGAFAHSHSQKDEVVRYILNQEEHHRQKSFKEEYIYFLRSNNIEYDERYIFHEPM